MAVKKGKGLFQERENLKAALNEKNTEIDRLKSELELNLSVYNECQDQITKLSLDTNQISQLEIDLVATQERADQLEKFLAESSNMLQRVIGSIEGTTTTANLAFEGLAEKLKWFVGYLNEREIAKMEMKQELIKVKDEASSLAGKFFEAQTMTETLEVALTMAKNNISLLLDEKKEFAVSKTLLEEELQKTKEEASSQTSRFEEVSLSRRALEDALSLAENNISQLMNNRDAAVERSTLAEERLEKLKEEFYVHISELADAYKTIQGLETAFSEAQKNIFLLTEENSKLQVDRACYNEVKKLKEEAESQASKLADATTTIKSLLDALIHAENDMADLVQENKNVEKEILGLTSKLNSCMEDLSGMRRGKEILPLELLDQLNNLQWLQKVEVLSNLLEECFTKKIESLKDMEILLNEMRDIFKGMDPEVLQGCCSIMEDTYCILTESSSSDGALNMSKLLIDEINAADSENITYLIEKMIERFSLKDKILADKVKILSSCMDESIAVLLNGLHITKGGINSSTEYIKSLKQQVKEMEADKERKEDIIALLESDIRNLSSSCTDAVHEVDFNVQKNLSKLISILKFEKFDDKMSIDLGKFGGDASARIASDHMKTAEMLSHASRHSQDLDELFLDVINKLTSVTEDMQKNLQESKLSCDEVMEEIDLCRDKIYMLETDIEALQNSCDEMKLKLDDYKEKEDNLRKRENNFLLHYPDFKN
ncbi:trans-Golgi network-localized SYP41-interacting protein 1-like isoform X2 [Primulina eburnea]|uniref:trans-Golgi network-localized SYP41-interacting protein 1-like isoform X2 n=1 Tax=Primulina eburnea TaxID=1245227 RepID=UPI003C6C2AC1